MGAAKHTEEPALDTQLILNRYSRRNILKLGTFGMGAAAFLAACSDDDDGGPAGGTGAAMADDMDDMSTGAGDDMDDMSSGSTAMALPLVHGWYRGREVQYYDFGMTSPAEGNSVLTAPIYAFITGMDAQGNPQFVEGQHNIVGVVPGEEGYSDLWQVMLVKVDGDYEADSVKSVEAVMSGGFEVTETDTLVNCPIVPEGTTLEGGEALVQGWHNGEPVFYPDFGPNPAVAIPIWAFITGMDASGAPQFLEGQMNIIDSVPDEPGYSAFWRVNLATAPEGYEANSIKSAQEVRDMQLEVAQTDLVVNCPVTVF